jgi:hypothetical protein
MIQMTPHSTNTSTRRQQKYYKDIHKKVSRLDRRSIRADTGERKGGHLVSAKERGVIQSYHYTKQADIGIQLSPSGRLAAFAGYIVALP